MAKYMTRRLAETEQAIDAFAETQRALLDAFTLMQKALLKQQAAEFALSFDGPSERVTRKARAIEEPKEHGALQDEALRYANTNTNLGDGAGENAQLAQSTAIGVGAGENSQEGLATAVGAFAGSDGQQEAATALGSGAGQYRQGRHTTALGGNAGHQDQGVLAIAIGWATGYVNQGAYSVALGTYAGKYNQHANTIILSAAGELNSAQAGSFYVKPIRAVDLADVPASARELRYDPDSGEIFSVPAAPSAQPSPVRAPVAAPTSGAPTSGASRYLVSTRALLILQ